MRMLVGLTPPTSGSATVLGRPYAQLSNPGRHVGVLLDASAQHPGRTGREVLTLGAALMGLPRSRVEEMVELVGLTPEESRRRIRDYSLGMRQRLGIAHALLGDPEVLVLDEPANGLDPGGIHWMRGLLRRFADRGGSVLLSSHLLAEIEAIADDLVIIGGGRVVAQGLKTDLLAVAGSIVRSPDPGTLLAALGSAGLRTTRRPDGTVHVDASIEEVGRTAAAAGAVLTELRAADGAGLEEMFLQLTAGSRDEVPA
jgi:ABC-2 type transport system ATP-binding protein